MAGPSSRKRSYAEVSRSESPLEESQLRPKRRRISTSPSISSNHSSLRDPTSPRAEQLRYEGDGFDYRRPLASPTQGRRTAPIDLTADDDPPSPQLPQMQPRHLPTSRMTETQAQRGPPFGRTRLSPGPEVIDLLTDSDASDQSVDNNLPAASAETRSSRMEEEGPELIIVGARTVQPVNQIPIGGWTSRHLPHPQQSGLVSNMMQRAQDLIFRDRNTRNPQPNANSQDEINQGLFRRIDAMGGRTQPRAAEADLVPDLLFMGPAHMEVALNYQHAAFEIGTAGDFLEEERNSTPPDTLATQPYLQPAEAAKGFSRNLKDDDIVVCPSCGDELALGAGDEDVKQQIWIAKQCGHVYCGTCATSRTTDKNPNKREQRAARQRKALHKLKTCAVEGCKVQLGRKAAMIQIYL